MRRGSGLGLLPADRRPVRTIHSGRSARKSRPETFRRARSDGSVARTRWAATPQAARSVPRPRQPAVHGPRSAAGLPAAGAAEPGVRNRAAGSTGWTVEEPPQDRRRSSCQRIQRARPAEVQLTVVRCRLEKAGGELQREVLLQTRTGKAAGGCVHSAHTRDMRPACASYARAESDANRS